ncbi:MAG: hypothetical protein KG003_10695 [Bacteroidetes bacterium]|nr:hypothetical protein [Bacteroidota bacterium]
MKNILFILCFILTTSLLSQNDQWSQLGMVKFPENPSVQTTGMGRVSHLVFHPTDSNILFAVSASGGLWKSSNEGQTWKALTDGLPNTACASGLINYKNPNTIYLGTGDANYYGGGMGVWKSMDGGKTWTQKNSGMGNVLVVQMAMHPTDTNIIVATTNGGIYKTTNGGNTWTKKSTVSDEFNDLVIKPGSGFSLYATSHKYFYYSKNFGESWMQINVSPADTFYGVYIGVTPADTNLVYTVAWRGNSWGNKTYFGGVFKSTNAGLNWKLQSNQPQILGYSSDGSSNNGQGSYNLTVTVDPKDPASVYVGAICIWKSRDSGVTWRLKSPWAYGVHADKHHFIFSPNNSKKLYIAHDGGIDRSTDTGNTWKTISDGLSASEFYRMGQSSLNREKALGGLQDNGLNYYKDGTFYTIRGGDYGGDFLFDYQDSNYQYYQGGGNQYNLQTFGSRGINGQNNSVYELHRKDTNIMYMGYHNLYRTNNLRATSPTWNQLSDSLIHYGTATTTAMAQSKSNMNILYWARNNGILYRVDFVNSSKPVFNSLTKPAGNIQQIITHSRDSNVVYITIGSKIYKSSDKGKTWWNFSKNLPANYIVGFAVDDRAFDSSIYVATNFGVYYKNRNLANWTSISKNLPAIARITDMDIFNDGTPKSCIRISTYGRGIWQTSLYQYQTKAPVADFSICPSTIKCPKNYILNDISSGGKYTRVWNILPYDSYKYINGTDSLSRQPEIMLTKSGSLIITLNINNNFGTSSSTKTVQYSELGIAATCTVNTGTFGNYLIGIHRFEMGNIDKSSNFSLWQNPNLEDFSCSEGMQVKAGNTYTAWVTNGTLNNEYAAIFIDYNNDGDFADANELAATFAQGKGRRNTSVKILTSPPVVNTWLRMRVVSDFSPITSACGTLSYGQAEDYAIYIDNKKPSILWTMPKPKVYGHFTGILKLSEYCPAFDTGKLKFTNGRITGLVKRNPLWYELEITPNKPGKIFVNLAGGAFTDPVGNSCFSFVDSTLLEMAITSFTFPGHSKYDSLVQNDSGGTITCYVYHGTNKDSLVAQFGVTDSTGTFVGNIAQQSGITVNNFSNNVYYIIKNPDGLYRKKYLVRVVELPDTSCELFSFAFKNPDVTGIIKSGLVEVTVPYGTSIQNRSSWTTISPNARLQVYYQPDTNGISKYDFRYPVPYKVIAEDSNYFKDYMVKVLTAKNTACDLLSWNLVNPVIPGNVISIDSLHGSVTASIPFGSNNTALVAAFTLSDSATFEISGNKQNSGITANNYSDTLIGIVTSQDGNHKKTYKIFVNILPNTAAEMLTFQFKSPNAIGIFNRDTSGGTIKVDVPENADLTSLVASFTISDSAITTVVGVKQFSDVSVQNFSTPLSYKVTSQSGTAIKNYVVTVNKILGLYDPNLELFSMYPNPAKDYVSLQIAAQYSHYEVRVSDVVGRIIFTGKDLITLNCTHFVPGVYEVEVRAGRAVQTKMLVKE